MKKSTLIFLFFVFYSSNGFTQKLDSILNRSSLSFNYGLSHDVFACCADRNPKLPITEFYDKKELGEIFGFEYGYRVENKKNEWGFGFTKQISSKDYTASVQTRFASIELQEFKIRNAKNFHYIFLKRHFIDERLIGILGLYNLRYRDSSISIIDNSDETLVFLTDSSIEIDFGVFVGLEYYFPIRNFQVGARSRLYYTQGYLKHFESFEITPVIRFKL